MHPLFSPLALPSVGIWLQLEQQMITKSSERWLTQRQAEIKQLGSEAMMQLRTTPAAASATSSNHRNKSACVALGGNLASIGTADDYQVFREMANTATGRDKATWLGGYDAVKEGVWKWSDGSNFNFTAWYQNEPNNHGNGEHCMEMNFSGKNPSSVLSVKSVDNIQEKDYVNDMSCSERRSFICAKETEYEL
ncbi:hypothetical protein PAMA_021118 [Pampus argenteus]